MLGSIDELTWQVGRGQEIGSTGVAAPVPIEIVSSSSDVDVVVNGRNVSHHQWGYQLVVLDASSGEILQIHHFDTESFLVDNTRAYQIAEVRYNDGATLVDPKAWIPPDLVLDFSDAETQWYLDEGWSVAESWGTWAIGTRSILRIALSTGTTYVMQLNAFPYCAENETDQTIRVLFDGLPVTDLAFEGCDTQQFEVPLPESTGSGLHQLEFIYGRALSPYEATNGVDLDQRALSVGFELIEFAPSG